MRKSECRHRPAGPGKSRRLNPIWRGGQAGRQDRLSILSSEDRQDRLSILSSEDRQDRVSILTCQGLREAHEGTTRKSPAFLLLSLFALLPASAAHAAPGGRLGTLPIGRYLCELPGSATTAAGIAQPKEDFAILHSSRYEAGGERGIYLLTGDLVQITSGPKDGARYRRISEGFLRKLNLDGTDGELRCVRGVLNNGG